jgi:hypothetical protein
VRLDRSAAVGHHGGGLPLVLALVALLALPMIASRLSTRRSS